MIKFYVLCILAGFLSCFTVHAQNWQPWGPDDINQATYGGVISQTITAKNGIPYLAFSDGEYGQKASVKKFESGNWTYVGTPGFSNTIVRNVKMAFAATNTIYVVYTEGTSGSTLLKVKKFNGATWEDVGPGPLAAGNTGNVSLVIDAANTPYVLFSDYVNSNMLTVKKYDGSNWVDVGSPGAMGASYEASIALDNNNVPYVAYKDEANGARATVVNFDGTNWAPVGSVGLSAQSVADILIAVNPVSNTPYILYTESFSFGVPPFIKQFDGTTWQAVSSTGILSPVYDNPNFTFDVNGVLYFAWLDGAHHCFVTKFNGAAWDNIGPATGVPYVDDVMLALAIDENGVPYTAVTDQSLGGKVIVKTFNSSFWATLGTQGFSLGEAHHVSIKIDGNNKPYVSYLDYSQSKVIVRTHNGAQWITAASNGFWATTGIPVMAIDATNAVYLLYSDANNANRATVLKYNGTTWSQVGPAGFSDAALRISGIAVDAANTPYVVYRDGANGNRATVKKFNGTIWETLGTPGFTAGSVYYPSIAINSLGEVFIAYTDEANSSRATVQKFDGTTWQTVGTPGFSTGSATELELAIDGSNTLYTVYEDAENDNKATLKKFDGSSWVDVGTAGFSTGAAEAISIALSPNGTPYVGYRDEQSNGWKATVKKYNGTSWVDVGTPGFSSGSVTYFSLAIGPNGIPVAAYANDDAFVKFIIETVLPLRLLSFNGNLVKNDALLTWKADNEENTLEFVVERSTDGRHYAAVGSVDAVNTIGTHQYTFADKNVTSLGANTVYYRLKQKDIDGSFTHSGIVAVSIGEVSNKVICYPNPVTSQTGITVTVEKSQTVLLRVIDNAGKVVKVQQWNVSAGSTSLPVDMSSLSKGIYYLDIKGTSINKQISVIKQ